MKISIVLLAFAMSFASCKPEGQEIVRKDNNTSPLYDYRIIAIDNCQYIEVEYGISESRIYSLTHKGDCNNPKHSNKDY
jgi:hypothetical protein